MTMIKLNAKNIFIFLIITSFTYIAYLIWTAKESFPQVDVELKDIVSYLVLGVEMGGTAVARIYAESANLRAEQKAQMDVGRAELVTKADMISNALIAGLLRRLPLLQVITEEKQTKVKQRELERYRADNYELWMGLRELLGNVPALRVPLHRAVVWIDPLDATQEYTEGLTQFVTVMACIAIDGKPIAGVVHSPFQNETVLGVVDYGLFSSKTGQIKIGKNPPENRTAKTIVVSRSHAGNVSEIAKRAFPGPVLVEPAGGAGYKALRLIRETADLYIHTTTIKKWDICAGDALIRAAGGALLSLADGLPLDYSLKGSEVHRDRILMALDSPFTVYEQLKPFLH